MTDKKLLLFHSDDLGALIVSSGPDGKSSESPEFDARIGMPVKWTPDPRPVGTVIGMNLETEEPKIVVFGSDRESAQRMAANIRRALGNFTAARNLKAADLRAFGERPDTIYLADKDKSKEETTGAYYRLTDAKNPVNGIVVDADGNPAPAGHYERKDDKAIISAARLLEIGEGGVIEGPCREIDGFVSQFEERQAANPDKVKLLD